MMYYMYMGAAVSGGAYIGTFWLPKDYWPCMPEDDIGMCDKANYFIRCPNGHGIVGLMQYL